MRNIHNTSTIHMIDAFLKANKIRKKLLEKALILVGEAIQSVCCENPEATIDLQTPQEGSFINMIKSLINSLQGKNDKRALRKIFNLLQNKLGLICCSEEATLEVISNHTPVATPGISGYASLLSGGDYTNFSYSINNFCAPYSVEVAFDFGPGFVVTETTPGLFSPNYNILANVMPYLLGKTVNIGTGNKTVIADGIAPGPTEINANLLNGRTFTVRVSVTDCNNDVTSRTTQGEIEMKRVTKMVLYQKAKDNNECLCAKVVADLYPDRNGGGNTIPSASPNLGHTIPSNSIASQNVFNAYPVGAANAKWRVRDTLSQVGGFHSNILFRNPVIQIIDAVWLTGTNPAADINCLYTFILLQIDLRETDVRIMTARVHSTTVANCPPEPHTFNNGTQYNTANITYPASVQVGDILAGGFSDTYQVLQINTPASLGW